MKPIETEPAHVHEDPILIPYEVLIIPFIIGMFIMSMIDRI